MIDEHIFTTEINLPDEFESILNVSIQHERLVDVMKFVITTLQRHEKGMKAVFDKNKWIGPEVKSLMKDVEVSSKKCEMFEIEISDILKDLKSVKTDLSVKHDTGDTLKFVLSMITGHDSLLNVKQKEIEELMNKKISCSPLRQLLH